MTKADSIKNSLKYVECFFKFKDDLHGLGLYFKRAWVYKGTTLVIDFELEGLRIAIDIESETDGYQSINLVLRENRRNLEINLNRFLCVIENTKYHLFLYSTNDDFSFCLAKIVQTIKDIFDAAKEELLNDSKALISEGNFLDELKIKEKLVIIDVGANPISPPL